MPLSRIQTDALQSAITSGNILDGTIQTVDVSSTAYGLVQNSFRNRIINGDMRIDQRNAGASLGMISGLDLFPVDRISVYVSSNLNNRLTAQRNAGSITPPPGFTNYLGVTSVSALSPEAGNILIVNQQIEGNNIADLDWGTATAKPVTISFWVLSSLTGTHSGSLFNMDQNRSYVFTYSINVANTWEYKTITVAGPTNGTFNTNNTRGIGIGFDMGSGTSRRNSTVGSWQTGMVFGETNSIKVAGTNGATFYITGLQFEVGTVATPFERRSYGVELALCQRYFETSYDAGTAVGTSTAVGRTSTFINGLNANSSNYGALIPFKVPKRATPTINWYGVNGTASQWTYCIGASSGAYYGVQTNSTSQIGFEAGTIAPLPTGLLTAGQVYLISGQWSASSEL
jgi:hypothetical protein